MKRKIKMAAAGALAAVMMLSMEQQARLRSARSRIRVGIC